MDSSEHDVIPSKLTPEQSREMLEALERARRRSADLLKYRAGQPIPESWELLNESRDERTRQLSEFA
jgi:hypothetical protein